MEFLEIFCCLLEVLNALTAAADVVAYRRSEPNRQARRIAKRQGEQPPKRNAWTITFLVLTPILIALSVLVLLKWVRAFL